MAPALLGAQTRARQRGNLDGNPRTMAVADEAVSRQLDEWGRTATEREQSEQSGLVHGERRVPPRIEGAADKVPDSPPPRPPPRDKALDSPLPRPSPRDEVPDSPAPRPAAPVPDISVTFKRRGPLGLRLKESARAPGAIELRCIRPGTQAVAHEATLLPIPGLYLKAVDETPIAGLGYQTVLDLLRSSRRPVTLSFSRSSAHLRRGAAARSGCRTQLFQATPALPTKVAIRSGRDASERTAAALSPPSRRPPPRPASPRDHAGLCNSLLSPSSVESGTSGLGLSTPLHNLMAAARTPAVSPPAEPMVVWSPAEDDEGEEPDEAGQDGAAESAVASAKAARSHHHDGQCGCASGDSEVHLQLADRFASELLVSGSQPPAPLPQPIDRQGVLGAR
jgi:hypothetical protein